MWLTGGMQEQPEAWITLYFMIRHLGMNIEKEMGYNLVLWKSRDQGLDNPLVKVWVPSPGIGLRVVGNSEYEFMMHSEDSLWSVRRLRLIKSHRTHVGG